MIGAALRLVLFLRIVLLPPDEGERAVVPVPGWTPMSGSVSPPPSCGFEPEAEGGFGSEGGEGETTSHWRTLVLPLAPPTASSPVPDTSSSAGGNPLTLVSRQNASTLS